MRGFLTLFDNFFTFLFDFILILGKARGMTDFIEGLTLLLPLFTAFIAFAGFIGVMGVVFGFVLKIIQKPIEKDIADLKVGQTKLETDIASLKAGQVKLEANFKELRNLILKKL